MYIKKQMAETKTNINKDLIEDKLYQLKDQFNERKINHGDFCFASLDNIYLYCDRNGRTCKILFVSNFS